MKVIAKKNRELALINARNTQNENRAETIELIIPEEYENYNKKIVFITPDGAVWDVITDNKYKLTNAITKYGKVDFYIWLTKEVDGESIDFRTKTKTLNFYHNEDASDEITDEEIHGVNTVVNLLEEEIEKVENLNIEATKIGDTTTLTITKKDGTTESVEINDGVDGQDGQDGYTPQKGIDYFTEQDIEEIETDVKNDIEENVLVNYSLIAETGAKIELSINQTNYKLTAILKDKNNATICTSNEIDLPLETMVVNATYDNLNKAIILTLQNGTTVSISVADLVSGLVSESQLQTILSNFYNKTEINNLLNNKVDKVQGKELSTNDFTDILKEKLEGLENYDDTEVKEDIEALQTENARFKATLPTTTGEGQDITLDKTAEMEFIKPPLPMGNSEQVQYSGKNLAGPIQGNITSKGITIQATDKSISINGTATDDSTFQLVGEAISRPSKYFQGLVLNEQNSIKISAGTYILSSNEIDILKLYGNLGDNLGSCTSITSGTAFTITEDKYVCLGIYIDSGVAINKTIDNLQLEQGSTATSFEPYVGGTASPNPDYPQTITNVTGDVEVKVQNKNLWKIKNYSKTGWNITIDNPLKGLSAGNYTLSTVNKYITANKGMTIYFSDIVNGSMNDKIGEVFVSYEFGNTQMSNTKSITQEQINANYLMIGPQDINCTQEVLENMGIMIEKSSTATNYVEHKQQTFTFPLGNEKLMLGDYLADDGIHHVRGQVVLDGSEDWSIAADYGFGTKYTEESGYIAFRVNINHSWGVKTTTDNGNTFSNIAKVFSWFTLQNTPQIGFCIIRYDNSQTTLWVAIPRSVASTVLDFKTFLQNQNMIIENEIEESVYQSNIVPYTSAQQEVYNQIKQALSYEEQTNITSNTIALFSVEAYQSTKLILKEMATAIVALGGV